MAKKRKQKRSEKSAENKRKHAEMRAKEAEAKKPGKKAIKKKAVKKPVIEKSEVKTTPWPRAGENKEFEDLLDQPEPVQPKAAIEPKEPDDAALKTSDVAEWITWPFQLWSTSQDLPPIIKDGEALEIAEPLTRIMNRHGVSDHIPPDVIDGIQVLGRTIPVVKRGNNFVTLARKRKEAQAKHETAAGPKPQGAEHIEPKEVGKD